MQFTLDISIDRPDKGLDTILSESGEVTPENLKEVGQQLQSIFDGFDSEDSEVRFDATASVTDDAGVVSNVTVSNVKKHVITAIITTIGATNQTPPIYVPPVSADSFAANEGGTTEVKAEETPATATEEIPEVPATVTEETQPVEETKTDTEETKES